MPGTPSQPQRVGLTESSSTAGVVDTSVKTGVKSEAVTQGNTASNDVRTNGYPKPESRGVNPKVVQWLDQRNRRGVTGGITTGGSDQMEVTVDQRFAQSDDN